MKKLKENLAAKLIACFMSMIMVIAFLFSVVTTAFAVEKNLFGADKPTRSTYINEVVDDLAGIYMYQGFYTNEKIAYKITDKNGKVLEKNHMENVDMEIAQSGEVPYHYGNKTDTKATVYFSPIENTGDTYITIVYFLYEIAYDMLYFNQIILIVSFILIVLLLIFMVSAAGHKKDGILKLGPLDKVPFDVLTVVEGVVSIGALTLAIYVLFVVINLKFSFAIVLGLLLYFISMSVAANYIMSFAVRFKMGKWWKNTVIYKVLRVLYRLCIKIWCKLKLFIEQIPSIWKWAVVLGVFILLQLIWAATTTGYVGPLSIICLLGLCGLCAVFIKIILEIKSIKNETDKIAEGEISKEFVADSYHGDLNAIAKNIGDIKIGMTKAVDEKMKSERFKTELITNVSHDIKTPLTSIINYTDLLGKVDIENKDAKEYIEVLNRQSLRLKKLIEDLIEASKAASGVLSINKSTFNVSTFIDQTIGEYSEKLKNNNLEVVTNIENEKIYIEADGRRMWRVFENIMNNICKYTQPSTRVYIDVSCNNGKTYIVFKNISKYRLNISGEELMERFVRGDKSRHTEGSGLGLSIAKNLIELQDGIMDIQIDGDLFKVIISF